MFQTKTFKKIDGFDKNIFLYYEENDYLKKYNGYFKAIIMCLPNTIMNIFQILPYIFFNFTKAKYKYFKIEGFICVLMGLPSYKRSKFDKKYIY